MHIQIGMEGTQVLWSVQGTGGGIPKAEMPKLFDKFYRVGDVLAVEAEETGFWDSPWSVSSRIIGICGRHSS